MTKATTRAASDLTRRETGETGSRFWCLDSLLIGASGTRAQEETIKSHGYSFYGDLKYGPDYTHFDYVNPDAPKGGEISIATLGTFDSMNPYTRKGRGGALSTVMYESLLGEGVNVANLPADVYGEYYCLLCESLEYPTSIRTG